MGLPESGPTSPQAVADHLGMVGPTADELAQLDRSVRAVNRWVRRLPCAQVALDLADWSTADDVVEGSTMLAARIHSRRQTPDGVAPVAGDLAVYVSRNDPDVAMLLQLGPWAPPRVG